MDNKMCWKNAIDQIEKEISENGNIDSEQAFNRGYTNGLCAALDIVTAASLAANGYANKQDEAELTREDGEQVNEPDRADKEFLPLSLFCPICGSDLGVFYAGQYACECGTLCTVASSKVEWKW